MLLKKPSGVGISLHTHHIEVAYMQGRSMKYLENMRFESIAFADDVYENGRVHDIGRFAGQVAQLFDSLDLNSRNVTLALPSAVSVLRPIQVPNLKKHKLREIIQFRLGKEIQLPFAEPVFDFDFLPVTLEVPDDGFEGRYGAQKSESGAPSPGVDEVPVLLVAAPANVVNDLRHAFDQAGVELGVMEVSGISLLRALKAIGKRPTNDLLLLEFGLDRVEAHIFQKGHLVFTRTLELAPTQYVATAATEELVMDGTGEEAHTEGQAALAQLWKDLHESDADVHFERVAMDLSYQVDRVLGFYERAFHRSDGSTRNVWLTGQVPFPQELVDGLKRRFDRMNIQFVHVPSLMETGVTLLPSLSVVGTAMKGVVSDAD